MIQRLTPWWLLLVCGALFAVNIDGYLLFDHDEGAFSEASRGMFERGNFLTTYLNDRVRFDKPILIYWLQAASMASFGVDVWVFRLPSVLAGLGWVMAIFWFCRRFLDHQTAVVSVLMAATTLGINAICHTATADALLNAILATTLLLIYSFSQTKKTLLLPLIYLLMALGTLTKGPVAVAIPLMVAVLFYVTNGQSRLLLRALFYFPGWILFFAVAAPWYVLEYLEQGQAFIDGFILKHNVNRFNNAMEGHTGGFLFYPMILPFILAPFGALLIRIIPTAKKLWQWSDQSDGGQLDRFLWIWFAVVLVLFSIASTKLPHYILYGVTPLIILMARYRHLLSSRLLALLFPLFVFGLFAAMPQLIPVIEAQLTNPIEIATAQRAQQFFNHSFSIAALVCALISAIILLVRRLTPSTGLLLIGGVQALFVWFIFVPAISEAQQRPVYEAAKFAALLERPIITQSIDMPSFNVYLNKVTVRRPLKVGEIGFAREDRLKKIAHYRILFQSGPIVIIERTSTPADEVEHRRRLYGDEPTEPSTHANTQANSQINTPINNTGDNSVPIKNDASLVKSDASAVNESSSIKPLS